MGADGIRGENRERERLDGETWLALLEALLSRKIVQGLAIAHECCGFSAAILLAYNGVWTGVLTDFSREYTAAAAD